MGRTPKTCWAFIKAKFGQFIYGHYQIEERWRVDVVFLLFAALLVPMAIPKAAYKRENALALLVAFPAVSPRAAHGRKLRFQPLDQPYLDRHPRLP